MTQTLANPELKPQGNPYALPDVLWGDWSGREELTYRRLAEPMPPQKAFTGGIEVADCGNYTGIYIGYVSHREAQVIPAKPRIQVLNRDNTPARIREAEPERIVPAGRAIYVVEVDDRSIVARAGVRESAEGPYVGYFDDKTGSIERDARRLHVMHLATLRHFGVALDSGPSVATDPVQLEAWHELVAQHLAEANPDVEDAQTERYHFLGGPALTAA